jgi:5-methylcytosine-specific restriction endonuclease McrA
MREIGGISCNNCNYNIFGALVLTYKEYNGSKKNGVLNVTKYRYFLNNLEQAKQDLEILCYNCHRQKMNRLSRSKNTQYQKYGRTYDIKQRKQIMTLLNQYNCVNCGESDLKVLEIDHIKGVGSRLFKVFKSKRKEWLYFINNSQKIQEELQILYRNCRKLKQFDVLQEPITVCC